MTSLVSQAEEAVVIGGGLVMKPGVIGGGDLLVPLQGFGQPGLGVVTVQPGLMSGGRAALTRAKKSSSIGSSRCGPLSRAGAANCSEQVGSTVQSRRGQLLRADVAKYERG